MSDSPPPRERLPEYQDYLCLLARAWLGPRWQARLDPSDLVQQTLLEAHRDFDAFRGSTAGELAAWLRRVLARNLAGAARDLGRHKRDPARERSLEQELDDSSARLEAWLADSGLAPPDLAARNEELARLAALLAALPEAQRQAVELRHLHGWSLDAIAACRARPRGCTARHSPRTPDSPRARGEAAPTPPAPPSWRPARRATRSARRRSAGRHSPGCAAS
jgi:RNA polymerase sigma-70 factor (ECF subfamily)